MTEVRDTFEPADIYNIDTLEKLQVISNPLRMKILESVIPKARTIKEIGDLLGMQSNTRYYHMSELTEAGMARVVHSELVSGIQQKWYRASARYFRLEPHLLYTNDARGTDDPAGAFLIAAIERTLNEFKTSLDHGLIDKSGESMIVTRRTIRATPEQAMEFKARLRQLEEDFSAAQDSEGTLRLELGIALFPGAERDD